MNSDEILAELDAQYQELIHSVQLEGLSQDENSEQSSKQIESFHKGSVQNVTQIIKKYEQTLQTSREFYENEITKLDNTKRKTELKYIESKKQLKHFENRISKISENHQAQIITLTQQKHTEIELLNEKLKHLTEEYNKMQTNQQCFPKLKQENTELKWENIELKEKHQSAKTQLAELQSEYATQTELLSKKKTSIEKYKLEIIQTRTSFDDQQKELKECRNEINFLCTTNEDLYNINEKLSKQLQKHPQENSLLNCIILDENSEMTIKKINEENEENKGHEKNVENDKHISLNSSGTLSVFNLQDNNIKTIETLECPELKTSNIFMIEDDNKIKQELHRISYDQICKEKNALLQKLKEYETEINYLQTQLFAQQTISNEIKEGQMSVINVQNELENMLKENEELKVQKMRYDDKIKEMMQSNEKNKNEVLRVNAELDKLQVTDNSNEQKEKRRKFDELKIELNALKEKNLKMRNVIATHTELKGINSKLESQMNVSQLSRKQLNDRLDTLMEEYTCLQAQFHEIKLKHNQTLSTEESYKQEIHKLNINIKFTMKELEQAKTENQNLRQNNTKQTEEISQLNHDVKQIFRDLENARIQLMQSQQLITTLEKQLFAQTEQLQQTRQQLQMQMQMNMQHFNVMNNLKNTIENNKQNINTTDPNQCKINAPLQTTYTELIKRKQRSNIMKPDVPITMKTKPLPQTSVIPNNIINVARGKPFLNRQSSLRGNNRNARNERLSSLLKQRQKHETELFKLPTLPRSLEQRKKKHSLEYTIREIETQIESIKKSK